MTGNARRQAGIRAINLLDGEQLVSVRETDGGNDLVLAASTLLLMVLELRHQKVERVVSHIGATILALR